MADTRVTIAGVEWKNPVTVASGTFGSGEEFADFVDLNKLGAVTTKALPTCRGQEIPRQGWRKYTEHVKCHWSAESGD